MPPNPTVAVLAGSTPRVVALDEPFLRADDLGATRGDGAFETLHVRGDGAWLMDAHLARLANSLERLEIPAPDTQLLRSTILTAVRAWNEASDGAPPEAGVKLIVTRGPEFATTPTPTVYAMVFPIPASFSRVRREGITLAALNWGFDVSVRDHSPWLLGGVKSLSYATNMATIREAHALSADDALLVSSDGYVLEGPTSGVVWLRNNTLYSATPGVGILPSTTVTYLKEHASEKLGWQSDTELLSVPELLDTEGVWVCSSVRGVVPVKSLVEGDARHTLELSEHTATLQEFAGTAFG